MFCKRAQRIRKSRAKQCKLCVQDPWVRQTCIITQSAKTCVNEAHLYTVQPLSSEHHYDREHKNVFIFSLDVNFLYNWPNR